MRGQRQAVMNHLLTHGEITSMEAYELYGCTRLAALIFDFRRMGYKISTLEEKGKNRFGESTKYARYVMSKENRYKGKVPVDKLIFLYKEKHLTPAEIASEVGYKETKTVVDKLKKAGVILEEMPIDIGKIKALYKAHWSVKDISFEMKLPESKILDVIEGIKQ